MHVPADPGAPPAAGSARVRLDLEGAGFLVLRDAEGGLHRVGREPDAAGAAPPEGAGLAFDLPPGTYRVVSEGRRVVRAAPPGGAAAPGDSDGPEDSDEPDGEAAPASAPPAATEVWWLSTSAPSLYEVELRAGAVRELAPVAAVELRAGLRRGQVNAEVRARGEADGAGTTLYRDGRRVPIAWTVEDAEGAVHARGDLRYG